MKVYVEEGSKLVFASAIEWPGYARSAKNERDAVARLVEYGPRYAKVVRAFKPSGRIDVVQRMAGGSGTDFGVISIPPDADDATMTPKELERQTAILRSSWKAFDAAVKKHAGATLAKGPRGGGRDMQKIVGHVNEADAAYVREIGGKVTGDDQDVIRRAAIETLEARVGGWEPEKGPRRKRDFWTPRYYVRRAAWHVLDHLWEIEDRAT